MNQVMPPLAPPKPLSQPITLQPDSWEWRLVRRLQALHKQGNSCTMVVKVGDCTPHWLLAMREIKDSS